MARVPMIGPDGTFLADDVQARLAERISEAASAGVRAEAAVTTVQARADDAYALADAAATPAMVDQKVSTATTGLATEAALAEAVGGLVTDAELADALAGFTPPSGGGVESVSGTVTLDATGEPIREFYTTGATTFRANGVDTPLGAYTAVVWRRTAQGSWGYQVVQDGWTTPTPDMTAPIAGTLAVTVTDVKADLTVSGASDDRGAVQFSFSKDNGTTWTAYQDAASYAFTGLTASTSYQFRHRVRDAAGNVTTGTAVSKTTAAAPPPALPAKDTFTGAPDGSVVGRLTEVGNFPWETGGTADYVASGAMMGLPTVAGEKATKGSFILTLPTEKASIEFDYNVSSGNTTTDIIRIAVASDGSTPLMAQINANERAFKMYNGTTQLGGSVSEGFKNSGHALASYDGATFTLSIDGVQVMSQAATGKTGKRFGFNIPANATATITVDNVEVKAL